MSNSNVITIRAKLLTYIEDMNGYIVYVFENLDYTSWSNQYVMCTRYPNWEGNYPELNVVGFLQYTYIYAGTPYYNKVSNKEEVYQYSHIRFDRFLPLKKSEPVDNIITL